MKPNPKQQQAIDKIEGPLLIIAGAGSGKTATLTARVENMIRNKSIEPSSILMVTFTNKAALEMRERVAKVLGVETPRNLFLTRNFPLIGTFHSIGIYFLKQALNPNNGLYNDISERLGLKKDFVIYDESDKLSVLKSIIKEELKLDEKEFPARQIAFFISNAKNALISAKAYEREIDGPIKEVVFKVYTIYEKKLTQNNAMDFDDILVKTLSLLQIPGILEYYQEKYLYLMIDEYQDTNAPQYNIVKLLASKYRNLAVVGDDAQCLVKGTEIETISGKKKIEDLKIQEEILSYNGEKNKKTFYKITDIYKNNYENEIVEIKTESGKVIKSTPEHIFFASVEENFEKGFDYGVYLMYKFQVGYRIGFTRFKGLTKSKRNIYGLRKRLNGEQADFAWILKTTNSKKEAKFYEQFFSFKYSIPQTVFTAKGKLSELDQEDIDNIYQNINTEKNANKLLNDLGISKDYPHVIAQASNRFNKLRVNINLLIMGGNGKNRRFGMFRVTVHTSHKQIIDLLKLHFPKLCRKSRLGIRIDKELADYSKIWELAQKIYKVLIENNINTFLIQRLSFTDKSLLFLNAGNIHPGFGISVFDEEKNIYRLEKVIEVNKKIEKTTVYDLNISRTHNFVANNILTHNSIYSWRGANMQNILNFKKDYPEAKIIKLEQNYRSTKNIIAGANAVIAKNTSGIKKELWSDKDTGSKIIFIDAFDDKLEAKTIVDIIKEKYKAGQPSSQPSPLGEKEQEQKYKDNLILYRTNAQSRKFEEALMIANIPYRVVGGLKFYDRKEIKDLLAYLRVIYNKNDIISLKRIINTPTRKIGAKSIEVLDQYRNNFGLDYFQIIENIDEIDELRAAAKTALKNFVLLFRELVDYSKELQVADLIKKIIELTKYEDYITDGLSKEEADSKKDNLDELINIASEYNGMSPEESLSLFLEEVSLLTDVDRPSSQPSPLGEKEQEPDYVTLMTIHTSKGLEQNRVFLVGLEEGIFPSFRSVGENAALEEERRLMYVAMTRAREELYISKAKERFHFGDYVRNPESRFLKEIPSELIEEYSWAESQLNNRNFFENSFNPLKVTTRQTKSGAKLIKKIQDNDVSQFNIGDKVSHPKFGNGIIVKLVGETADISFTGKGIKKMNVRIAPVRKI